MKKYKVAGRDWRGSIFIKDLKGIKIYHFRFSGKYKMKQLIKELTEKHKVKLLPIINKEPEWYLSIIPDAKIFD